MALAELYSSRIRKAPGHSFRYFIEIKYAMAAQNRYKDIHVVLQAPCGKKWQAIVPYKFWCNKQSIRVHCTVAGVPKVDDSVHPTYLGALANLFKPL